MFENVRGREKKSSEDKHGKTTEIKIRPQIIVDINLTDVNLFYLNLNGAPCLNYLKIVKIIILSIKSAHYT